MPRKPIYSEFACGRLTVLPDYRAHRGLLSIGSWNKLSPINLITTLGVERDSMPGLTGMKIYDIIGSDTNERQAIQWIREQLFFHIRTPMT